MSGTSRWAAMLCLGLGGCYAGVDPGPVGFGSGDDPTADGGASDSSSPEGGTSGDDGGDSNDGEDDGVPGEGACAPVGGSVLARLTAIEYENAVRDLLGVEGDFAAGFPGAAKVAGFDIIDSAPSEFELDGYAKAAVAVAEATGLGALPCSPEEIGEDACADAFIEDFGRRAFRRPLEDAQREMLWAWFEDGRADDGFEGGVRQLVQGVLQSPAFIYHLEVGEPHPTLTGVFVLDDYELASRLSFMLWQSTPDRALLDAADAGALSDPSGREEHTRRMLEDPRARDAVGSFHQQWLGTDRRTAPARDADRFADFDDQVWAGMGEETTQFASAVIFDGDATLETLLGARWSVMPPELADYYGVAEADRTPLESGGDSVRVEFSDGRRGGLLALGATLTAAAHSEQTSPVLRGKLVIEQLLCEHLSPPPADVDDTPPEVDPDATAQERLERHLTDPSCTACHARIDPLGFGFEHFDAVGRYRERDGNVDVDASGEIVAVPEISGPFYGLRELSEKLAVSERTQRCVTRQWFRYALARPDQEEDQCRIDSLTEAFVHSGGDVHELIVQIATADAFSLRRISEGEE